MAPKNLIIKRLFSGGLITNYYCTSRCGHCLYGCSPRWEKEYIDKETAAKSMAKIKALGCRSIHVGGGEPFLDPEGLKVVLETAFEAGMGIDYIETNSSWFTNKASACRSLEVLKKRGLNTLLISISPFHNEHIPFYRVKGVIEACKEAGINIFPWIYEFYNEIDAFDDQSTHQMSEYEERYGSDYLKRLPSRYWIHLGGRALKTFATVYKTTYYKDVLSSHNSGCSELLDVSHFHFDLFGNYIPGLCSGLAIESEDLGHPLSSEKYPILNILFQEGINGFFKYAASTYDFAPADEYLSKCHLCFDIRQYLVLEKRIETHELQPRGFYENIR